LPAPQGIHLKYPANFRPAKEMPEVAEILDGMDDERFWREYGWPPAIAMTGDGQEDVLVKEPEWIGLGDGKRMRRRHRQR